MLPSRIKVPLTGTAFTETADPEDVMGVLAEYHDAMGRLILACDGTLERFGDLYGRHGAFIRTWTEAEIGDTVREARTVASHQPVWVQHDTEDHPGDQRQYGDHQPPPDGVGDTEAAGSGAPPVRCPAPGVEPGRGDGRA